VVQEVNDTLLANVSNARRTAVTVFSLFLLCSVAIPVCAQDQPAFNHVLFTSPIQEAKDSPIDVLHLRQHLFVNPEALALRGALVANLLVLDIAWDTLRIPVGGIDIDSVMISSERGGPEMNVDWSVRNDTLMLLVADSLRYALNDARSEVSAEDQDKAQNEVQLTIEYSVRYGISTRPVGTASGNWSLVWTDFQPGNHNWIPLPTSVDDRFSAELRVTVPSDWIVHLSGNEHVLVENEGRKTVGTVFTANSSLGNIGFVAFRKELVSLSDDRFSFVLDVENTRSMDETRIAVSRIQRFYAERMADRMEEIRPDSGRIVVFHGPEKASSSGAGLSLLPADVLPDGLDSADEDFRLASAAATIWVRANVPLSGWTDVWIHEALPEFMAALYVRDRHGEAAYAHVLWNLRREYLEEGQVYLRPLVWDRWMQPVDMQDAHARGKGAWIFHMLAESYGEDVFWTALNNISNTGVRTAISTEELRAAYERASGHDLIDFFDQWVYAAGHPEIEYDYRIATNQESISVTVRQVQDGYLVPGAYTLAVDVESASLVGVENAEMHLAGKVATASIPVPLRPQYVLLDPGGKLLFEYVKPLDPATIVSSLRRDDSITARYLASRRLAETTVGASMLIGLRPILAQRTARQIDQNLLISIANMAPSSSALREILAVATDSTARTQSTAIEMLGAFVGSSEARNAALNAANSSSDPLVLSAAVEALIRLDSTLAWRVLQSALVTESLGDIVKRTAIHLIPIAPVDDEQKISRLISLLEDASSDRIRQSTIEVLARAIEESDVRELLFSYWPTLAIRERRAILDQVLTVQLNEKERETVATWLRSEPDPLNRRLLRAVLSGPLE